MSGTGTVVEADRDSDQQRQARARRFTGSAYHYRDARLPVARAQDARLWELIHGEGRADRQLARGLSVLSSGELYRPLGFVRASDFVREYLGIKESRALWLAKLGQRLREIPELDEAHARGRISASHAMELGKLMSETTSASERQSWIDRASRMTVRELCKAVKTEKRKRARAKSDAVAAAGDAEGANTAPDNPDNPADQVEVEVIDFTSDSGKVSTGGWMTIPAPARVAVLWHLAVDLARAVSGRKLSLGQCADVMFAEFLSAFGHEPAEETAAIEAGFQSQQLDKRLAEVMRAMNRGCRVQLRKPDLSALVDPESERPRAERWPAVDWQVPEEELAENWLVGDGLDPWRLAAALLMLCAFKKQLRYEMAGLLERLHEKAHWHVLGFASLEAYCEQRLSFGVRRAERLMRFRRGLDGYERLRRAYFAGGISYTAALQLLSILHPRTEKVWVEWADGVTYREVERVVEYARTYMLPDAHPSVIASWVRGLIEQGYARDPSSTSRDWPRIPAGREATAFAGGDGLGGRFPGDPATAFAGDGGPGGQSSGDPATAFAGGDGLGGQFPGDPATAFAGGDGPGGQSSGDPATAFAGGDGPGEQSATDFATAFAGDGGPGGQSATDFATAFPGGPTTEGESSSDLAVAFPLDGPLAQALRRGYPDLPDLADIPLGYALPPAAPGALPTISGIPSDLALADPELCVARIRFWQTADALELTYRTLRRCRQVMPDPLCKTWVYFEVILVHFMQSQDTPAAREILRRHRIIARDGFRCCCPGCTSRGNFHEHHHHLQSQGGPDEDWNLSGICAGHHGPGVHKSVVEMGGWAPDHLVTRLGIDPRTGRALVSYINDHRVSDEIAKTVLARWRQWLRVCEQDAPAISPATKRRPQRLSPPATRPVASSTGSASR